MSRIKICGLTRREDIEMVNIFLPDYVGFVFAQSTRKISEETADALRQRLKKEVPAVGVFVDAPEEQIITLCRRQCIQMVQLHGNEDRRYMERLKEALPDVPILRAVRVQNTRQILEAQSLPCEYLLLDSFQRGQYGGSGKTFDRSLIPPLTKPFFVAGGVNGENVETILRECRPFAVDVSSGAETDRVKDPQKIKDLVEKVRKKS